MNVTTDYGFCEKLITDTDCADYLQVPLRVFRGMVGVYGIPLYSITGKNVYFLWSEVWDRLYDDGRIPINVPRLIDDNESIRLKSLYSNKARSALKQEA